jgi:hypothetical protein
MLTFGRGILVQTCISILIANQVWTFKSRRFRKEGRKVNRLIAIGMILTILAADLKAQQPTPARRASATAAQNGRTPPSTNASTRKVSPKSNVQPAVAQTKEQPVGTSSQKRNSQVVKASAMQTGEVIYDDYGSQVMDPGVIYDAGPGLSCDSCNSLGCDGACGVVNPGFSGFNICNPAPAARQLCICLPAHGWVQIDYLNWYQQGMYVPQLVTTRNSASGRGVFSENSSLLEDRLVKDSFDGGRIRFGWWFANNPSLGLELEYLGTGKNEFNFSQRSNGTPFLARPFYDVVNNRESSELVASPGVISGLVSVNAFSELQGGAVRFRKALCCGSDCVYSCLSGGTVPTQSRIDATLGWRTLELREGLTINEDLTGTLSGNEGTFLIQDSFKTRNMFNGAELGFMWQGRRGYWTLDTLLRTSLGVNRQEVTIAGFTDATPAATGTALPRSSGGLLTQPSNIGTYVRDQFSVLSELGATLGYQLTSHTRLTAGYTFIYWSNVVRPGEQVDTDVNINFLPERTSDTVAGLQRPALPTVRTTDYFIQGLNLGAEYRW